MFWFKPFRNFLRKITIFRNFDQWSEILSVSDGRPLSQVFPSLAVATHQALLRQLALRQERGEGHLEGGEAQKVGYIILLGNSHIPPHTP